MDDSREITSFTTSSMNGVHMTIVKRITDAMAKSLDRSLVMNRKTNKHLDWSDERHPVRGLDDS